MSFRVELTPRAEKDLEGLPKEMLRRIDARILAIAANPRPSGVVRLAGTTDLWRLRVGDYRILFTINDAGKLVQVARVLHRSKAYRGL